jgi:hypothetical protein
MYPKDVGRREPILPSGKITDDMTSSSFVVII